MLNIENLKCGFGKHEILHGISLTIPKGQITAIVGQSGCGKTTFLKTLNRMVEEEGGYLSGTITLEGTDIKSLPKEKLRRRVGMVFQQPIAFPHSIEKNLSYVLKYHGVRNKKEIAEKITESLQKAKLYDEVKDQLKNPPSNYPAVRSSVLLSHEASVPVRRSCSLTSRAPHWI